jgi:hypothetical protein
MGEIMPYYNELAKTTVMEFDPFETLNITSETDSENTGTTTADSESESTESSRSDQSSNSETASRNVNSDHPQTRLNEYEDYATSSAEAVSESASTSDGSSSGTQTATGKQSGEQSQHHRDKTTQRGTQGNKSQMLQDYRDTILGVDVLILDELEVLFMGVWDTDQSYTRMELPNLYANPHWYTGL